MVTAILAVIVLAVIIGFGTLISRSDEKRRLQRLAELNEYQEYDLVELWKLGFVLPRGTGQTITHINAEIENKTDKKLKVIITPGTYFVSTGSHQNMVTRSEHRVTLRPKTVEQIYVPASCINAGLPIPSEQDRFHGVAKVSTNLVRFLEKARYEDAMVVQAGVWALTDNYSKYDIQTKLVARMSSGRSCPAVTDAQVARAKQILDGLGIPNRL